jgi:hypothetical protein
LDAHVEELTRPLEEVQNGDPGVVANLKWQIGKLQKQVAQYSRQVEQYEGEVRRKKSGNKKFSGSDRRG